MKIYNSYILIIAILLLLTTVILVAMGQNALDAYCSIYIIEALVVTELYVYLNAKARRGLSLVSVILFGVFLIIISYHVIQAIRLYVKY